MPVPSLVSRLRRTAALLVPLLLLALVAGGTAPAGAHARHGAAGPARIDLPDGWQPEGITTDGRSLYAGSLADGAIAQVDPRTGSLRVLAAGAEGRVTVGLDHDRWRGLLWAAGGDTGEVRAYSARTGRLLATYTAPTTDAGAMFLNDVAVTKRAVYVTDSVNQRLVVIPVKARHHGHHGHHRHHRHCLPPAGALRVLPLTGDLVYGEGFNLNGIVAYRHALLAVQSSTGLLFRIAPRTGVTRTVGLGGASLTFGDGLERHGRTLYAVRNQLNTVAVLHLGPRGLRARQVGEITSDDLDVPTTVARLHHSLYAVNARFSTTPTPDTAYWITRLPARP